MSSALNDRQRWGLRIRLLASTTAILALAMSLAFTWSAINLRGILEARNDRFLRQKLDELTAALVEQAPGNTAVALIAELRRESEAHAETGLFAILHRDTKTEFFPDTQFARSVEAQAADVPSKSGLHTLRIGSANAVRLIRSGPLEIRGVTWSLDLGLDLKETGETEASFNGRLALGGAACLLIALFGGLLLTRQAVQPVANCIAAARRLNPHDLSARLPLSGTRDELDQLASTINQLLDRVAQHHEQMVRFTADASHELRGPLAALQAAIEVSLQCPRTEEGYRDLLGTLGEQCQRLTDLVNALLLLARADAGQITIEKRPVDLVDLVRQSVDLYQPLADERAVRITTDLTDHVLFIGDRLRLGQLVTNLLDNAIKFTDAGGTVLVRLRSFDRGIELVIKDTGVGIPAEHIPHVFDRFYRIDESRSGRGTGLGLSICRWIVAAHEGTIEIVSTQGRGTTVTIGLRQ